MSRKLLKPIFPSPYWERRLGKTFSRFIEENISKINKKKITNEEIEKKVTDLFFDFYKFHDKIFRKKTPKGVRANLPKDPLPKKISKKLIEATVVEVMGMVDNLSKENSYAIARASLLNKSIESVKGDLSYNLRKTKRKAELIGASNIRVYNFVLTRQKHKSLGIKKGIWTTALDERVRPTHSKRQGKEYDLDKGCSIYTDRRFIYPAISDYGCRCTYKAVLELDQ